MIVRENLLEVRGKPHTVMDRLDAFTKTLRRRGWKVTPQRVAILEALVQSRSHPTAEEIHRIVRRRFPMVSLATVYKTLRLLRDVGQVGELGFADGGARYDANVEPHINVVCIRCGAIRDVDEASLKHIQAAVSARSGYQVVGHRFELYGYCRACASNPAPARGGAAERISQATPPSRAGEELAYSPEVSKEPL